ncbi:alpha/beta fold hydrolase [Flavobacterium sp.]|jgi:homoserine O-acetyltransferase|uniref:alpha/beta fold hydrolase n=1 Tax=Flavobacterium sp. TaxID=239 RepID=UPI0037BFE171
MLEKIEILDFTLKSKIKVPIINLTYQVFGKPIGFAPVVLVNHALTGNSNVSGPNGWWNEIIGAKKTIDTEFFTVIAFNIPGNGFNDDYQNLIHNYKNFSAKDVAKMFWKGIKQLGINELFVLIGGSLGGGIAWEMAALKPNRIRHLIPIATHWKASNWVVGNVLVQEQILNNSQNPIADARLHAMLLYRTPKSINQKFTQNNEVPHPSFPIENWLLHHGVKLKNRFSLPAYKLMNHLLKTIDISKDSVNIEAEISRISGAIHLISVDTDLLFTADETQETFNKIKVLKPNVYHHQIKSVHGHDAFLIEHQQLSTILKPIFNTQNQLNHVSI